MKIEVLRKVDLTPEYPIYIVVQNIPGFERGQILTSEDGILWSNPALSGTPYVLKRNISSYLNSSKIMLLDEFLQSSKRIKFKESCVER